MEDTTQAFPGSNDFLNLLSSKFEEVFSRIYYLGPIRVHPQRNYHWEGRHPEASWTGGVITQLTHFFLHAFEI